MELKCSSGNVDAKIGDRYADSSGEWEIVAFGKGVSYSPAVLGGTPNVVVRPIGHPMPSWYDEYANDDGTIDMCGDSVAAMLLAKQDGKSRSARGEILTLPGAGQGAALTDLSSPNIAAELALRHYVRWVTVPILKSEVRP